MSQARRHVWKLNCVRTGPRGDDPVVLVHPAGLDLTYWEHQIEALRDQFDVVAFDLPGHGRSPGGPADWTFEKVSLVLAQVIESTGARAAHVVGLSVGGFIAQALVTTQPRLVRSLSLIGTAPIFTDSGREALRSRAQAVYQGGMQAVIQPALERWFSSSTMKRRPDIVDRVTKTLLADDPSVHAAVWEMLSTFDVFQNLRKSLVLLLSWSESWIRVQRPQQRDSSMKE